MALGAGRVVTPCPWRLSDLTTVNLNKLEAVVDVIRKGYPKLAAADATLIATALMTAGRDAIAVYDDQRYMWPIQTEALTTALARNIELIQMTTEAPTTKKTKASAEDEVVVVSVNLAPNLDSSIKLLGNRKDLIGLFNDIIESGVEFHYMPTDIGWQWALDRVNWSTVTESELTKKFKHKVVFAHGATGVELGTGTARRRTKKADTPEPAEVA